MFAIQWIYALVTIVCYVAITVYISLANSAVFPGLYVCRLLGTTELHWFLYDFSFYFDCFDVWC